MIPNINNRRSSESPAIANAADEQRLAATSANNAAAASARPAPAQTTTPPAPAPASRTIPSTIVTLSPQGQSQSPAVYQAPARSASVPATAAPTVTTASTAALQAPPTPAAGAAPRGGAAPTTPTDAARPTAAPRPAAQAEAAEPATAVIGTGVETEPVIADADQGIASGVEQSAAPSLAQGATVEEEEPIEIPPALPPLPPYDPVFEPADANQDGQIGEFERIAYEFDHPPQQPLTYEALARRGS